MVGYIHVQAHSTAHHSGTADNKDLMGSLYVVNGCTGSFQKGAGNKEFRSHHGFNSWKSKRKICADYAFEIAKYFHVKDLPA